MSNQRQQPQRERPVRGTCWVPNCECQRVWPSSGLCVVHNQLISDFRTWLGFDPQDPNFYGNDGRVTRCDDRGPFDCERLFLVPDPRFPDDD
jgi:hypothetical protein